MAGSGCGSAAPFDRYVDGEQARTDSYCGSCWMSGNWTSEQACRGEGGGAQAFYGDLSDSEIACMRSRYETSPALDAALGCLADALGQFVACNSACTNSPDDTISDACYDAYVTREGACLAEPAVRTQVESIRSCAPPR